MICKHCGVDNENDLQRCKNCATLLSEENVVNQSMYYAPALQLATNRSLLKFILLGIITLGIYPIVVYCKLSGDINLIASRYDGQRTMHYLGTTMVAPLTLGIYVFVWNHKLCNRIGKELKRRNVDYNMSATDFWLWDVLGSLIIVGPFVYTHKMLKAMNLLSLSYNYYG